MPETSNDIWIVQILHGQEQSIWPTYMPVLSYSVVPMVSKAVAVVVHLQLQNEKKIKRIGHIGNRWWHHCDVELTR